MEMIQAASLNNAGLQLEQAGQYPAAEAKYLRALELNTQSSEAMPVHRALTQNCLGELYLKMNRLDEAQEMLELALVGRAGEYIHTRYRDLCFCFCLLSFLRFVILFYFIYLPI